MSDPAPLYFGVLTIESIAILISTTVALGLGYLTIRAQRELARRRVAFETLNRNNWDSDYIERRASFVRIRDHKNGIARFATANLHLQDHKHAEQVATIRHVLNDYENIAIGIRRGIIDEDYMYRFMRSTVIRDWYAASAFVISIRNKDDLPQLYVEVEGLATAWRDEKSYLNPDRPLNTTQRRLFIR